MLAALRSAVASVASEMAEKNAVARVLAQHGHRRPPSVISQRDASGVTRVYLWADAGIALVTGPSLQGTVYEVRAVAAGVDPTTFDLFIPGERGRTAYASGGAKRATVNPRPAAPARPAVPARAPLVQAPRRIGAAPTPQPPTHRRPVLTRHNPPAAPIKLDPTFKQPPPSPLPAGGIGASFSTDTFKALPPNPVWEEGGGVNFIASRLKPFGPKPGGGLSGEVLIDPLTGNKYLFKHQGGYGLATYLPSEVIAAHLYRALGIYAPDLRIAHVTLPSSKGGSTPGVLSPWVDGLKKFGESVSEWNANVPALEKKWLAASFPADVWLADYDVVGLEWDNLLALPDGHSIRIDPGASLFFRASGQDKQPLPGEDAGVELDTMLFVPKGDKIQHVFALAKDDPALMLPMAQAIVVYMTPAYVNAVVDWATASGGHSFPKYLLKLGLPAGTTLGDYLHARAQSLLKAIKAKTGTATASQVVTSSVAPTTFSLKVLASRIANLVPGATFGTPPQGELTVTVDHVGAKAVLTMAMGYVRMAVSMSGTAVDTYSALLPSPITPATYGTLAKTFADTLKQDIEDAFDADEDEDTDEDEEGFDLSALPQASSVTLLTALPKGSVVCDEEGDTLLHKDENGLWRELVESGMMLSGKFSGSAFTSLGTPIYLLIKGDGEGLAPGDKAGLKALWKEAQAVLTGAAAAPASALPSASEEPEATTLTDALVAALQGKGIPTVKVGQSRARVTKGMTLAEFDVTIYESDDGGAPYPVQFDARVVGKPATAITLAEFDYTTLAGATATLVAEATAFLAQHGFIAAPAAGLVTPPVTPRPAVYEVTETLSTLLNKAAHEGLASFDPPKFFAASAGDAEIVVEVNGTQVARFYVESDDDDDDYLILRARRTSPLGPWQVLARDDATTVNDMAKVFAATALKFIQPLLPSAPQSPVMTPAPTPIAAPVATPFTPVPLGDTPGFTPFAYALPLDPVWDTVGDWYAFLLRIGKASMGQQLGSFPGGKVTDPLTKASFYVKAFTVAEHARTEALACRLYRLLGINAPDVRIINNGSMLGTSKFAGKTLLISPWKDNYQQVPNGAWTLSEREALATTFAADVWMANYDVVGKGPGTPYDNLLRGPGSPLASPLHYLRVDQGAALDYRSTGSTKKSSNDWGTNATWTWKNFLSDANPTIKKVFGLATYEDNVPAISRIANLMLRDNVIEVFEQFGRDDLFDVLMERAMSLSNAVKKAGGTVTMPSAPVTAPAAAPAASIPIAVSNLVVGIASALTWKGYEAIGQGDTVSVTLYGLGGGSTVYPFKVSIKAGKLVLDAPTSLAVYGITKVHEGWLNNDVAMPFADAAAKTLDATGKVKKPLTGALPPTPTAPPAAGPSVGSLLTTLAEVDALPAGSLIVVGTKSLGGSSIHTMLLTRMSGGWDVLDWTGKGIAETWPSKVITDFADWAGLVLRVGIGKTAQEILAPTSLAHPNFAFKPGVSVIDLPLITGA